MSSGSVGVLFPASDFGGKRTATGRRAAVTESSQGRPLHDQGRGLSQPIPSHPMRLCSARGSASANSYRAQLLT
jgi:hypothetical protein